jgi:predicted acylesterase/phospholipase RssA
LTDWPISECIDKFRKLYERAFAPREFHSIPLLQKAITTHHGSVYKTKPLYTALKQVLGPVGERQLFGGSRENDPSYVAKVALTSTDEAGKRAVVIANYNRNGDKGLEDSQKRTSAYEFPRPSNPSNELTYWEAAAATSATPPYFKPFFHQSSHRYFWDGSLNNSNPAKIAHRERKLLWPDVANMVPDIFLSIGTSQHKSNVDSRMLEIPRRSVSHRR